MTFKDVLSKLIYNSDKYKSASSEDGIKISIHSETNADCTMSLLLYVDCSSYGYNIAVGCYNPYLPIKDDSGFKKQLNEFIKKEYLFSKIEWGGFENEKIN